jgi:hypothetical protein
MTQLQVEREDNTRTCKSGKYLAFLADPRIFKFGEGYTSISQKREYQVFPEKSCRIGRREWPIAATIHSVALVCSLGHQRGGV